MAKKKNKYYNKTSLFDEAIRTLRTNISFSSVDKEIRSLAITSARPNEGKSKIALELSRSMAENGKKVMLVDCDLRRPSIGKKLGVKLNMGLTNILVKRINIEDVAITHDQPLHLDIVLTGPIPPNPSELLGSDRMKNFLVAMSQEYDMIILDTPPAGILTDAQVLSTMVDGVLLVVNEGETKAEEIEETVTKLKTVGANIIGAVLNKATLKLTEYGYY